MNSKGLLYSTGNCIQCLLITYNPFSPLQNLLAHLDHFFLLSFLPHFAYSTWAHQARPVFSGFCLRSESLSHVWLFAIPWTVAFQAPLSVEFSRQEYWSELPFLSSEDLPDPGIEPESPALQADSLPSEPPGNASLITLFYSTSCRRWAGCSEFGVDWKRKRLRGAHTTDIFYITHWFVAFKLKETEAQIQWRGREQTQS